MKKSFSRLLVLGTLLCASLALAAVDRANDPDGGLARGYFTGLKSAPQAKVEPSGKKAGNIIFLVVDAMRPDHMGMYGYDKAREATTPFLDEWSKDGLVFLHHQVNAPWTRPSTATMLTGLYPSGHKTQTDQSKLPAGIRTVGQDLRKLGYQTAAICGNGNGSSIAGLDRGFDYYVDTKTHWDRLPTAREAFDDALVWADEHRNKKKPFFLFVFVVDPHDPYHAPADYEKRFLPKGFTGEPRRKAHWEYKNNYPKRERDSMIAVYDGAVRYTDDEIKRFFGEMQKRGLMDDTTVAITADHGDGFGEHGYYLHAHHHYDEIIRVPLLMKSPALKGNGYVFHTTQAVDLLPTFVSMAGGKPRKSLPGAAINDLLAKPVDPERLVLTEYNAFGIRRSSILNQKYRVILQLPADEEEYLKHIPRKDLLPSVNFENEVVHAYDRLKDPLDKKNLAKGGKKLPAAAAKMRDSLRTYMENAPEANKEVDPKKVHESVLEDLRSLGYVQ
jgi:arylsulfatase